MSFNRYSKVKYPELISYQKFLRVKMANVGDNSFTEKEVTVPADISEGKVFAIHSIEFEQPALAASGDRFMIQVSLKEEGEDDGEVVVGVVLVVDEGGVEGVF